VLKREVRHLKEEGNIRQARLPQGSRDWGTFMQMMREQIEAGARANRPGFKAVSKLRTDKSFDI
jgi:hypothetical protein